jgi:hypothetical protein
MAPRFPLVKEWAYAGIVFNMTGAFVSHAAVGDYGAGAYHLITTGSIALLAVASYVLRPGSRMLAVGSRSGAQRHDQLADPTDFSLRPRHLDLERGTSQST